MNNPIAVQLAGVMMNLRDSNEKTFNDILVTGVMHRGVMIGIYNLLLKDGSITPIEKMTEEDKALLKDKTKKLLDGRLVDPKVLMDLYRAIHTMDLISKQ